MATKAFFLLVACKSRLETTCQAPAEERFLCMHSFSLLHLFLEQVDGEDAQGPSLTCCEVATTLENILDSIIELKSNSNKVFRQCPDRSSIPSLRAQHLEEE